VRRKREQQFGFLLHGKRGGIGARVDQPLVQGGISLQETAQETLIQPQQTITAIKVLERYSGFRKGYCAQDDWSAIKTSNYTNWTWALHIALF